MSHRISIFSTKGTCPQIGHVEGEAAYDLSGRQRCSYNAATGNLHDLGTGGILGYVSLDGSVVGLSWMIDDLFGNSDEQKNTVDDAGRRSSVEEGEGATDATITSVTGQAQEDVAVERTIEIIKSISEFER